MTKVSESFWKSSKKHFEKASVSFFLEQFEKALWEKFQNAFHEEP